MGVAAGNRIGPYEIVAPLGAGGMGEVYRARDMRLGREVALKVLPEAFAEDAQRIARLEREAKLLASLNHPNIATIYDFEDSDAVCALAMELVEGTTLAERIASGPIALEDALPIARQIAEGLEYAHERGVVHRDLKPANVKVTPEGGVKILDFGLAKALESDADVTDSSDSPTLSHMATQAGMILGTAAYMSPEQAKGKPVDRRTDIWAFGCVLYEMLTGKHAFDGETVTDILAAVIRSEPRWDALPPDVPNSVRSLISRCLQKDPKRRLRDIGDARIALEEISVGEDGAYGEETRKVETRPAAAGWRGRPFIAWIGGLLLGVALSSIVVWWAERSRSAPAMMHFSAVTSFAGVQGQPALSPDGRSVAFISNRDGHYNVYVGLLRGGALVQITRDANLKSRPSWSPDGSTIVYARMNDFGTMDIWEIAALGGPPRRVILNAADPTYTPDGISLVYENLVDGALWMSGVSGENPRAVTHPDPDKFATEPRVSPDGRMIAFAARNRANGPYGELGVADFGTGKVRLLTHDGCLALSPAWSPDSRALYFASSRGGTVNIWKIDADGSRFRQVTAGEGDDAELDVSADGKRMVFATLRQNIGLAQFDLQAKSADATARVLANDPARNEFAPAYSPDGTHVAFFTNLKGIENESIGVADSDGANARQLARDSRVNLFPRWSSDGNKIIYVSSGAKDIEFRSIAISGGAPQPITQGTFDLFDVGRDGHLLYHNAAGQVEAFDTRGGKRQVLGRIPDDGWLLRWSVDGSSVAYIISPRDEEDTNAGIWTTDFKTAPRQVFRGWAFWFSVNAQNEIFLLKCKADLNGELWKMKWDGSGLSRLSVTIPLLYNSNYIHPLVANQIDVSPDGRHVAFQSQQVLQENIGTIENLP